MYENLENKKNFLQSEEWRKFQESVGRKTFRITSSPSPLTPLPATGEGDFGFHASIIEHELPVVGKYFYMPKGPIFNFQPASPAGGFSIFNKFSSFNDQISKQIQKLINLAKENNASWIRIEPENEEVLKIIKNSINSHLTPTLSSGRRGGYRIVKAPHDMQPKETLIIDITKSEEELLAEMKSKTRYNIKLAQKHKVSVQAISNFQFPISNKFSNSNDQSNKNITEFIRLTEIMAKRQGIATHNKEYYEKMLEVIPSEMIKLYVAEYEGKIIAANIVIFYSDTCTYLHGASDDKYKNLMAPHLLQWKQIQDAKKQGCKKYDFFGIKIKNKKGRSWEGITRFKLGFSPNTSPIEYPGSYDIIVSPVRYWMYRFIQKIKSALG